MKRRMLALAMALCLMALPVVAEETRGDSAEAPMITFPGDAVEAPVKGEPGDAAPEGEAREIEAPANALLEAAPEGETPVDEAPEAAPQGEAFEGDVPVGGAIDGYAGAWVNFEDGFRLYLPEDWLYYDITDEQAQAGVFYRAGGSVPGGGATMALAVSYAPAGELDGPGALAAALERAGGSDVALEDLNGIDAVTFEREAENYRGAAFFHPLYPGYVLSVYVAPIGAPGEAAREVGRAILDSLRPRG